MTRTLAGLIALALAGLVTLLASGPGPAASAAQAGRPVIVIGLSGLRWSDVSASATPSIWHLARAGSAGSLATTTINTLTCPGDAWLTLNSGARATANPQDARPCPPLPAVLGGQPGAVVPAPATVPAMSSLEAANARFSYKPYWGVLGAAIPGCATAVGPGAALALADRAGQVGRYLPELPGASRSGAERSVLRQCPLTVIDLGALPAPAGPARHVVLAAADRAIGRVAAAAPAGAVIVLAGMGDDLSGPHLRVIVASGPGYRSGLLTSQSTRQHGIVTITDLTPSIVSWLGGSVPAVPRSAAPLTGSQITPVPRGSLAAAITAMVGQDTADQVYRSIVGWFFLIYGVAEAVLFAAIALLLRGSDDRRVRRRVAWYTAAGAWCTALPAGTFLAGLVPWGQFSHPALWLYGLGLAWAAAIAVPAVTGPWRRQPFGPPGFVCAVTFAVIGIDVMTGSRLELGAPFGLSLVEAGRFFGIGNNALGIYLVAALLTAAWAATAVLWRSPGSRRRAVAAAGCVAVAAVVVLGWPGFGAKVGGTIAIVPAFLVLLASAGGVRITPRRGVVVAVSGLVVIAAFAVLDYFFPAIGPSHLGSFVQSATHGGTGALTTLHRKISSNLHSLTETWFTPVIPAVAVVTGIMLGWPSKLRLRTFVAACERLPLLRTALFAVWLAAVLAWLAEDSGVSVVAAALPVALPLSIVLAARTASLPGTQEQDRLICAVRDNSVTTGRTG